MNYADSGFVFSVGGGRRYDYFFTKVFLDPYLTQGITRIFAIFLLSDSKAESDILILCDQNKKPLFNVIPKSNGFNRRKNRL